MFKIFRTRLLKDKERKRNREREREEKREREIDVPLLSSGYLVNKRGLLAGRALSVILPSNNIPKGLPLNASAANMCNLMD